MALVIFYPVLQDISGYVGINIEPSFRRSDPVDLKVGTLTAAVFPEDVEQFQIEEKIGEAIEWLRSRPALPSGIANDLQEAMTRDPADAGKLRDFTRSTFRSGDDARRGDPRSVPVDIEAERQKVRGRNAERKAVREKERAEHEAEQKWRSELKAKRA